MKGGEPVDGLSGAEQGFVVGAALLGAPPAIAEQLGAAESSRCGAVLEALSALPREERAGRLAALVQEVLAPVPRGIERVHPGWLREVLEGEATPVLRALVAGLPAVVRDVAAEIITGRGEDPTRVAADAMTEDGLADLRRAVFGSLSPILDSTAAISLDEVARIGAVTLGTSLQGAPREVVARAAVGVGEPLARVLIDAAAGAGARDQARALVAGIHPDDAGLGAAHVIGLYALAAEMPGEEECRAAAQRLPPALGQVLIRARDRARGID